MHIGIDLGTSNSVIAGIVDGEPRLFRPADGGDTLPSVIYFDKRGHRLYGRRAHDQAILSPDNVASGFKRLIGTATPIHIPALDISLTPEECSAEILKQLLAQAEVDTGRKDWSATVVTIPAAFNQMQCEATLRAANLAGLDRVALLQEPVAAALAALSGGKRSGQFLIYDLGGGTFDLAMAQSIDGTVRIVAHQGINMLGGRDFDRMVVNEIVRPWLLKSFDLPEDFQKQGDYRRLIRIAMLAAENAKIDLSGRDTAAIFASDDDIRLEDASSRPIYLDVPLKRSEFEAIIRPTIEKTASAARTMLITNGYSHEDIDRIVFIGGPSKIPLVRQMVSEQLGVPADLTLDPMTTVAVGAAWYCHNYDWGDPADTNRTTTSGKADGGQDNADQETAAEDGAAKPSVRVEIPAAQTIAIKVLEQTGDAHNALMPIIMKGQVLPAEGQQTFRATTRLIAGQPGYMAFELFQLEYPERIELNLCVGAFRINNTDLPKESAIEAGDPVRFTWHMTDSGILNASVTLPSTPAHGDVELFAPRFYAPQAGEISFAPGSGEAFASAVLRQAEEEWGDLAAAAGPQAVRELDLMRHRLDEQRDMLSDSGNYDAEMLRRISEEARFIRQDIARLARRHAQAVLQRRLGKLVAAFNRSARAFAEPGEISQFDRLSQTAQTLIATASMTSAAGGSATGTGGEIAEAGFDLSSWYQAERYFTDMRGLFFTAAWRDPDYVRMWFQRLQDEQHLFPDQSEYQRLVKEGLGLLDESNMGGLARLVQRMFQTRVALGAHDGANDLATISRG